MLHCGKISGDQVEQVKGITYSLSQFFGPIDWNTSDSDREVGHYSDHIKYCHHNTDLYHAVIYLSPGDCHQFHSPTEWTIFFRRHFPGKLLSVNPYVARRVPDIFCLNERVAYIGQWKHGFMSLIAVGATNVGSIQIYHDKTLRTNSNKFYPRGTYIDRSYDNTCGQISPTSFIRGDSFGEFHLGSTIVLIFEAPKNFQFLLKPGQKVKCGQQLGV
jgi:phosphatidylserine decarboxylase